MQLLQTSLRGLGWISYDDIDEESDARMWRCSILTAEEIAQFR